MAIVLMKLHCAQDPETYEQISLDSDKIGRAAEFLEEGTEVKVAFHQSEPVSGTVSGPMAVTVTRTDFSVKGDTSAGERKGATTSSGAQLRVPANVGAGDTVLIDPDTGEYIRKA